MKGALCLLVIAVCPHYYIRVHKARCRQAREGRVDEVPQKVDEVPHTVLLLLPSYSPTCCYHYSVEGIIIVTRYATPGRNCDMYCR